MCVQNSFFCSCLNTRDTGSEWCTLDCREYLPNRFNTNFAIFFIVMWISTLYKSILLMMCILYNNNAYIVIELKLKKKSIATDGIMGRKRKAHQRIAHHQEHIGINRFHTSVSIPITYDITMNSPIYNYIQTLLYLRILCALVCHLTLSTHTETQRLNLHIMHA